MITIPEKIVQEIVRHSLDDAPVEACGYLAGNDHVVSTAFRMKNIDQSNDHFSFSPQQQFEVVREMRKQNLRPIAVYHSHPESQARPSDEDIRLAADPTLHYVIISLLTSPPDVKSFRINGSVVESEMIRMCK